MKMKKILFAIMGAALLLSGCTQKGEVFYQNPYRTIVEYTPSTFTIPGISGTVTPVESYDWITSNGNGSFTWTGRYRYPCPRRTERRRCRSGHDFGHEFRG